MNKYEEKDQRNTSIVIGWLWYNNINIQKSEYLVSQVKRNKDGGDIDGYYQLNNGQWYVFETKHRYNIKPSSFDWSGGLILEYKKYKDLMYEATKNYIPIYFNTFDDGTILGFNLNKIELEKDLTLEADKHYLEPGDGKSEHNGYGLLSTQATIRGNWRDYNHLNIIK